MSRLRKKLRTLGLRLLKQEGFTLVELMVVVAIIALLAATALPQFRKYQAKSRISEAKLALAGAYTAEESYMAEYSHYASCLAFMGYVQTNAASDRYYDVGFSTSYTLNSSTPLGCSGAAQGGTSSYAGTKGTGTADVDTTDFDYAQIVGYNVYTIEAMGIIDKDNTTAALASQLSITDGKTLTMHQTGY